jgi:NADPH:quinone reductase-like Zn-dependent oxidoreductase
MRAYRLVPPLSGPAALSLVYRPAPQPGPGEVLLAMRAVGLNYRDLLVARGQYGKLPDDRIPGSDGVGVVQACGSGVSDLAPGQRVAGCFMSGWMDGPLSSAVAATALGGARDGVLAEQVVLPASGVVPVPEHLSDAEAACLPCAGVTAWNALFGTGATRAGETVLVLGTGGVAAFAIQFAHAAGCRVIAVSRSPAKLAAARTLGAHEAISGDDWDDQVYRLTAQQGVDHVIELGGPGTLPKSIRAVRMGGRISLIGTISGIEGPIPTANLLRKGVCLQGIFVGSRAHFLAMNRAIALHGLRPHVDREFAFTAAREAYEYLATASHVGKVVVRIAE